jgi:hypothetical protein
MCDTPGCAGHGGQNVLVQIAEKIAQFGVTFVVVTAGPGLFFGYSVGMTDTGLPEIYATMEGDANNIRSFISSVCSMLIPLDTVKPGMTLECPQKGDGCECGLLIRLRPINGKKLSVANAYYGRTVQAYEARFNMSTEHFEKLNVK